MSEIEWIMVWIILLIWQKRHKTHEISRRMEKIRVVLCNLHKKQYGDLWLIVIDYERIYGYNKIIIKQMIDQAKKKINS